MLIWNEMEKLVEMGIVRSIGVSNFNSEQINRVCLESKIKPVINQVFTCKYPSIKYFKNIVN